MAPIIFIIAQHKVIPKRKIDTTCTVITKDRSLITYVDDTNIIQKAVKNIYESVRLDVNTTKIYE